MSFQVIPAVDVSGGRLARLQDGKPTPVGDFGGDALAAAAAFVVAGARWLHVVDIDLAFGGILGNVEIIRGVCKMSVAVQVGGGLATAQDVDTVLAAGAARTVLGSAALADRELVESLLSIRGEQLAVALEVEGNTISPRGRSKIRLALDDTVVWLTQAGARRFVYTDVSRVGRLTGPNLAGIAALSELTDSPVLVAGGVSSIEDLQVLASLGPPVEGAIVGRALYGGSIRPADALRIGS